jgi:hypothetical protein
LKSSGVALILDFKDGTPAQEHFDGLVSEFNPTGHPALFLSTSRATNLAKFAGCAHFDVRSVAFGWRFVNADDLGAYFVKHHGLRCSPDVAQKRALATFGRTKERDGGIELTFDYVELKMWKS